MHDFGGLRHDITQDTGHRVSLRHSGLDPLNVHVGSGARDPSTATSPDLSVAANAAKTQTSKWRRADRGPFGVRTRIFRFHCSEAKLRSTLTASRSPVRSSFASTT